MRSPAPAGGHYKGAVALFGEFEFGFFGGWLFLDLAAVGGLWFSLAVNKVGQFEAQVSGVGGVGQASFEFDDVVADKFFDFAVEELHAFGGAVAHSVEKGLAFAFTLFDVLAGAQGGLKDFDDRDAAVAIHAREEALGKDEAEGFREAITHALLIFHGEAADDALDGFGGVDGVKSGEHEVAGFRGFQSDFDGFAVAHFADEDDFGGLAKRAAEGDGESRRVAVEFALVDGGFFMTMQEFDGVLNGEDVDGFFLVHPVDDGGEGGGLSRAGGTGDEDDAVAQGADFLELGGQFQIGETRDAVGDDAHDDGATAALAEDVDAEARGVFEAVGKIGGAVEFEFLGGVFIFADQGSGDLFGVAGDQAFEALEFEFDELPADFDLRRAAGGKDEVADVLAGLEHGGDELRNVETALN